MGLWLAGFGAQAAPLVSGIDLSGADPAVRMQDNLYLAINGGWRAKRQCLPMNPRSG